MKMSYTVLGTNNFACKITYLYRFDIVYLTALYCFVMLLSYEIRLIIPLD
jgi:hypothetical protein